MPELRVSVVMPEGTPSDAESEALDELMASLAQQAGRQAQLGRSQGMSGQGPARIFTAIFKGSEAMSAVLRGVGSWYMQHPAAKVTMKMSSSKGGTNLQLKSYSAVAFAQASAQIKEYLEEPDEQGAPQDGQAPADDRTGGRP